MVAITAAMVTDMLGLADRVLVFDLMDAVMAGQPRQALRSRNARMSAVPILA